MIPIDIEHYRGATIEPTEDDRKRIEMIEKIRARTKYPLARNPTYRNLLFAAEHGQEDRRFLLAELDRREGERDEARRLIDEAVNEKFSREREAHRQEIKNARRAAWNDGADAGSSECNPNGCNVHGDHDDE